MGVSECYCTYMMTEREWGRRRRWKGLCVQVCQGLQIFGSIRTRVEDQRTEKLNKLDIKNKPSGENKQDLVSLLWCNMTSQGKVQGTRKNREWTGQKEGKNIEQAEKQQKRETCENDSTIISWDLFTAEGVRSEKTRSTSRIPDKLEEFVTLLSFLSSHPSNQPCLKPFPSLQPLYLGNRVKPLIAEVPYQGTWCSGGQTWANQTYTHIHAPSNANKIAKTSKMQSN